MKITIKRFLGIIGVLTAIGFGVFVYGGWQMFGDELRAIKSLKMLKDRVYTFEYKGICVSDLIEIDGSTEVPDTDKADLTIVGSPRLTS